MWRGLGQGPVEGGREQGAVRDRGLYKDPLPVDRQTHKTENITLATPMAGGNYVLPWK